MKNLLYIFLIFLMSYWENEEVCYEEGGQALWVSLNEIISELVICHNMHNMKEAISYAWLPFESTRPFWSVWAAPGHIKYH